MRINQYVARSLGISRRKADDLIQSGLIDINNQKAQPHTTVSADDKAYYQDKLLTLPALQTILLHKPTGYICSRDGQGAPTIYDLLPENLHHLKPIGRLDKNSSGALLLTNDGNLAHALTHPSYKKQKIYQVTLNTSLKPRDITLINKGIMLDDGVSQMNIATNPAGPPHYKITMSEGKNRQIRRTLEALNYAVIKLHRTTFDNFDLGKLAAGKYQHIDSSDT